MDGCKYIDTNGAYLEIGNTTAAKRHAVLVVQRDCSTRQDSCPSVIPVIASTVEAFGGGFV